MTRSLLTLLVVAVLAPAARAEDAEGSTAVEIIRPTRARKALPPEPKELDLTVQADAPPEPQAQGPTTSERTSGKSDEANGDADARARAAQQKKIEELARKTQEEFRKAANALAGE